MFTKYINRWGLIPDGELLETDTSRLLPVRQGGVPAMLKIAVEAEEKLGGQLMVWWNGIGAAKVLAHDDDALLLERAKSQTSLADLVHSGDDDEASRIICRVVSKLHAPRTNPPPPLIPLKRWFDELEPAAERHGGVLAVSSATARDLLASQGELVTLHGDIHHGNILDFGERGWLAIDPKGLFGDRCFDYANIFCNPDHETATAPSRFARQVEVVAEAAGLDRKRLLRWILAWVGLSAAWLLYDGASAATPLQVAELATKELAH
jgi:streptomycin 6-kinase